MFGSCSLLFTFNSVKSKWGSWSEARSTQLLCFVIQPGSHDLPPWSHDQPGLCDLQARSHDQAGSCDLQAGSHDQPGSRDQPGSCDLHLGSHDLRVLSWLCSTLYTQPSGEILFNQT